ncbi:MAG: hypothetical protein NWF01_11695 [Candidatus Bathyarchaeota archaeon]|nr:hypothetical protein [Candidatus Bathyarchaeota archaeon]
MNWKNILLLMQVERKSGRLLRGKKTTRYKENSFIAYWPYWTAIVIGVVAGIFANFVVASVYPSLTNEIPDLPNVQDGAVSIFVILPTIVLIFAVVLTMLQQFQLAGLKAASQMIYWLPVTWQEHTAASILANLFGFPMGIVLGMAAGVIAFSAFNGIIIPALLVSLAMFASAFLASSITEIIRILQIRFTGAVYKSSGRGAVWVRFIGTLVFFIIFYVIYFTITQGFYDFFQGLTAFQSSAWYIPFVWPATTVFYLASGMYLEGLLFLGLSVLFIAGIYYLAVTLNVKFGLYEPPAIKVQKSGVYTPKTGFLGKIGFSTAEAALIRKDLRAFTRRRELMQTFIVPIVFILVFLMQSLGITGGSASGSSPPAELSMIFSLMMFLLPAAVMAMALGNMLIGEEGQSVWRIYASPISPKNLVKSKLAFNVLFSLIIMVISAVVGIFFYKPDPGFIVFALVEGVFLSVAVASISLCMGFRGADFSVSRRARMIRTEWAFISIIGCGLAGLAILAPFAPAVISALFSVGTTGTLIFNFDFSLVLPLIISGVIASVITGVFYKIDIGSAEELIRKAET